MIEDMPDTLLADQLCLTRAARRAILNRRSTTTQAAQSFAWLTKPYVGHSNCSSPGTPSESDTHPLVDVYVRGGDGRRDR